MKVLIVAYRRPELLERALAQLNPYFAMSDILVVDNHSRDSAAIAEICAAKRVPILRNDCNEGFAKAVNQGMRYLVAQRPDDWVLLLNPDAELLVDPRLMTGFASDRCACIAALDTSAPRPWDSAKPIPNPWRAAWEDAGFGRIRLPQPLGSRYRTSPKVVRGYLVGCYLAISTAAWNRIGEFDERFWLYSEEVDWCLRARQAGMTCELVPLAGYRHEAGQSAAGSNTDIARAQSAYRESRLAFIKKHWGTGGVTTYKRTVMALNTIRRGIRAGRTAAERLRGPR